jgi:hypothetical protein
VGGARGALLASLPTVAYVTGDAVAGLTAGAGAGAATAVVVFVERVRTGQRTTPAVVGLLVVLGLVGLALLTGRPEAFFLPAVLGLALQAAGLVAAAVTGRPVTGHVARQLGTVGPSWRRDPGLRLLFCQQDLMWAGVFSLRAAVTAALALSGSVAAAGVFRLTGTPMYIALVALCVRWAGPVLSARQPEAPAGAPSARWRRRQGRTARR